jgi:peptide chain release factor 1
MSIEDLFVKALKIYQENEDIYLKEKSGNYQEIKNLNLQNFYDKKELLDLIYEKKENEKQLVELSDLKKVLEESDNKDLIQEENNIKKNIESINIKIKDFLLKPKDIKEIILEIRAGTGGDEASLFSEELKKMYIIYSKNMGWSVKEVKCSKNESGGIKSVELEIIGENSFKMLSYESGVHRVQRIPKTESKGRVHTSTVTVAVLPKEEKLKVDIRDEDLRIDTYRASGAGGQHVNKTESAVRIIHLPTNSMVQCQDERSQHKNREQAMKQLEELLYEKYSSEKESSRGIDRLNQIGTGDRSEKIRTYNFGQNRVTDHRIGISSFNLVGYLKAEKEFEWMLEQLQGKVFIKDSFEEKD